MLQVHELDECRFDVSVGDCIWYLRAENVDERNKWVEVLDHNKVNNTLRRVPLLIVFAIFTQHVIDSAYGSENSLRRHGSAISLGSLSVTSLKKSRSLKDKLLEVETHRDILYRQIDALQKYLDAATAATTNKG